MNSMTERGKGRRLPDDGLLTKKQAADHLGVPLATISEMVRNKVLQAYRFNRKSHFYLSDLNAAARSLCSGITLVKAHATALQALAKVAQLERKMADMLVVLGVDHEFQPLTEELVIEKHQRVLDQLRRPQKDVTAAELMQWARFYFTLDEGFFLFATAVLGTKEPWLPFMRLGVALLTERNQGDLEKSAAFEFLSAAIRSARCAAYLVCRGRYGEGKANLAFPDTKDASLSLSILALVQNAEQRQRD